VYRKESYGFITVEDQMQFAVGIRFLCVCVCVLKVAVKKKRQRQTNS